MIFYSELEKRMDAQPTVTEELGDCSLLDVRLESVAIARLIEEVRETDFEVTRAYNRTYNRHNR